MRAITKRFIIDSCLLALLALLASASAGCVKGPAAMSCHPRPSGGRRWLRPARRGPRIRSASGATSARVQTKRCSHGLPKSWPVRSRATKSRSQG